jgi:hypothetical protein
VLQDGRDSEAHNILEDHTADAEPVNLQAAMAEPPKPDGVPTGAQPQPEAQGAAPPPKPRPQNPVFKAMGMRHCNSLCFTTLLTCVQACQIGA